MRKWDHNCIINFGIKLLEKDSTLLELKKSHLSYNLSADAHRYRQRKTKRKKRHEHAGSKFIFSHLAQQNITKPLLKLFFSQMIVKE